MNSILDNNIKFGFGEIESIRLILVWLKYIFNILSELNFQNLMDFIYNYVKLSVIELEKNIDDKMGYNLARNFLVLFCH